MSRPSLVDTRLSGLCDLWEEKRAGRSMPDRADFDPSILKPWLGNLILIDVEPNGVFRYRLYGSVFVSRFGVEMTNRTIDQLAPAECEAIRRDYESVVTTRLPSSRLYTSHFDIIDVNRRLSIQREETWERLVLPLTNGRSGGGLESAGVESVDLLMVAAYELSNVDE
ncbi:PAS domain-containing protein [Azospirillaceae bacterium]